MSVQVIEMSDVIEEVYDAAIAPTIADLLRDLGDINPARILVSPPISKATVAHAERYECELIDGTLVRKAMGFKQTLLAAFLIRVIGNYVFDRNLGLVTGPDGFFEIYEGRVRAPDVAFIAWSSLPNEEQPEQATPALAPDLCIEVISPGNTILEMKQKRRDYFTAGVKLVWLIDPMKRSATTYSADDEGVPVVSGGALDAATVIPGYSLPLAELFAELSRKGPRATPAGGGS